MNIDNKETQNTKLIKQDWWNKPLWGEQSTIETIKTAIVRKDILLEDIKLYEKYLTQMRPLSVILESMDHIRFKDPEFIFYLEMNYKLHENIDEYDGLYFLLELFRVALQTKNIFLRINEIELRYRSISQQRLYDFVSSLLNCNLNREKFIKKLKEKVGQLEPNIKNEEGRNALLSYAKELEHLAREEELGLKLLSLFKKENLSDLSMLRKIAEIVDTVQNEDLRNLSLLCAMVESNANIFIKLASIIGVPKEKNNVKVHGIMLQYISLSQKYYHLYLKFDQFLKILTSLAKRYLLILEIRQKYSLLKYKQPQIFRTEIPGLNIYQQYETFLSMKTNNNNINKREFYSDIGTTQIY